MVRFGRTVGSQVVDALTARLEGGGGSHVTVDGINLSGAPGVEPEADDPFGLPEWAKQTRREEDAQTLTADDLLLKSAFHLSSGGGEGPGEGPAFTAWGRVSTGGFEATVDDTTMDGNVTTGSSDSMPSGSAHLQASCSRRARARARTASTPRRATMQAPSRAR